MVICILCLGFTRENKIHQLDEILSGPTTFEEAIRQQISYADSFLMITTGQRSTCTTCFRTFRAFYQQLSKIHQNQALSLQMPIKNEIDDEKDVLDISTDDPEKMQEEYLDYDVETIKVEPTILEDETYIEAIDENFNEEGEIEWKLDEKPVWKQTSDQEEEIVCDVDANDTDYDPTTPAKKKKPVYTRFLRESEVTPEMIASGQKSVFIDGIEYKIPKIKKLKNTDDSKTENKPVKTKNSEEGDERVRRFLDIKCELCGEEFQSFFRLGKHFRRMHPGTEVFMRCCGKKYYRRLKLLDHLDSHDDSVVHKCEKCNKVYKTDKILKVHINRIHLKKYHETVCNICGRTFKSTGALNKHMIVHEEDSRQFECYKCTRKTSYKNLALLQSHFASYHNPNKPHRTVCHICSASIRASHLKRHLATRHSDKDPERVKCDICDHWIIKGRMDTHRKKHSQAGVNCNVCGKFLKSYGSLYSHMKIVHENCRDYKCDYCDKAFFREIKLKEHIAARHTREFLFKCRIPGCGREFRAKGNWQMHERKYHPEEYEKSFAPAYKRPPKEQVQVTEETPEEGTEITSFNYF